MAQKESLNSMVSIDHQGCFFHRNCVNPTHLVANDDCHLKKGAVSHPPKRGVDFIQGAFLRVSVLEGHFAWLYLVKL